MSNLARNKSEISSLYLLKAICAFFVVCCHVPTWLGGSSLTELPVPIFFAITGYFLYSTKDPIFSTNKVEKKIFHTLSLLVVLTLIYYLIHPTPAGYPGLKIIVRWLFISIPTRYGGPLWYLTSLFWGLIAFVFYVRLTKGKYVAWLILLVIPGLLIGKYRFFFVEERSSYFVFNFINYTLPCFSIGYLLHKYESYIISWKYVGDALILFLLCYSLEYQLLKVYSHGLSTIGPSVTVYPTVAFILAICLKYKSLGEGTIFEKIGKLYAGNIYYWHMIFVAILANYFGTFNGSENDLPRGEFWAIAVYSLALMFSILIVSIQKRLGINFFR